MHRGAATHSPRLWRPAHEQHRRSHRRSLKAAANQVSDADLTPAQPPTSATIAPQLPRRHVRWVAPLIAAAAVAGIAITLTAVAGHHPSASRRSRRSPRPAARTRRRSPDPRPRSPSPSQSRPAGSLACYFADASPCKVPAGYLWYVPLWPFANYTQARNEATIGCPANAACELSAAQTALEFTQTYLDFSDITNVTSSSVGSDEAKVGVGYRTRVASPSCRSSAPDPVRGLPQDPERSWEVVGSEDTTLSLEKPAYGSRRIWLRSVVTSQVWTRTSMSGSGP